MEFDELRPLRSMVYAGAFERAKEEYESLESMLTDARAQSLREVLWLRAQVERGGETRARAKASVGAGASTGLQAVRLLAELQDAPAGDEAARASVLGTLREWLSDEAIAADPVFLLGAALVLAEAGEHAQALRLVHKGDALEQLALKAHCLLAIDRGDLAADALRAMQGVDDDDALTVLAGAALAAAQGGDKERRDSMEALQEMVDNYGETVKLFNLQASLHMQMGNYADAFQLLRQARDLAKSQGDKTHPETLVNTMACVRLMQKAAAVPKIRAELEQGHPAHPWLRHQQELSDLFDRSAATYALDK